MNLRSSSEKRVQLTVYANRAKLLPRVCSLSFYILFFLHTVFLLTSFLRYDLEFRMHFV